MRLIDEFNQCTFVRKIKDRYEVRCQKGLWAVDAPTKEEAESEALHYFAQYRADGKYESILNPGRPVKPHRSGGGHAK